MKLSKTKPRSLLAGKPKRAKKAPKDPDVAPESNVIRLPLAVREEACSMATPLYDNQIDDTEWLTPQEVADWFRCKKRRIYELVQRDEIPHSRFGPRLLRFHKPTLRVWLLQRQ